VPPERRSIVSRPLAAIRWIGGVGNGADRQTRIRGERRTETRMDRLSSGERISGGEALTSPNGRYKVAMETDGNLVMYDVDKPVWGSNTAGSGANIAEMRDDGDLVIYHEGDKPAWTSRTRGHEGAMVALQDDRDLVVYAADGKKLWSSRTFVASSADTAVPPTRSAFTSKNVPPVRPADAAAKRGNRRD
jgi:hypothetical protein